MKSKVVRGIGLILFVLLGLPSLGYCQQEKAELPSANDVISRYQRERGGVEFLSSISSMHTVWIKSDSSGEWEFERWHVPGQIYAERRLNGEVNRTYGSWVSNPMASDKLLKGVSWWESGDNADIRRGDSLRERLVSAASIDGSTRWLDRHESVVCKSVERIKGKDCYRLQFKEQDDSISDRYFDIGTGLLVCTVSVEHDTGGSRVTREYSDYKEFSGMLVATKQTIRSGRRTDVWAIQKLEHEIELDMDQFYVPKVAQVEVDRMTIKLEFASGENVDLK